MPTGDDQVCQEDGGIGTEDHTEKHDQHKVPDPGSAENHLQKGDNEVGKRIKDYFNEEGMSQQEVAKILNVQQAAVSNQLNGRPFGKNSAAKWNMAFGFRVNWLLTGEGPMFDISTEDSVKNHIELHPELNHDEDIPVIPARLFRAPEINIYEYVMNS